MNKNLLQHNNELKNIIEDLKDLNNCLMKNNDRLKEIYVLMKIKAISEKVIAPVWCNQTYKQILTIKPVNKANVLNILINANTNNIISWMLLSLILKL